MELLHSSFRGTVQLLVWLRIDGGAMLKQIQILSMTPSSFAKHADMGVMPLTLWSGFTVMMDGERRVQWQIAIVIVTNEYDFLDVHIKRHVTVYFRVVINLTSGVIRIV